jgi:hypothetical protein
MYLNSFEFRMFHFDAFQRNSDPYFAKNLYDAFGMESKILEKVREGYMKREGYIHLISPVVLF